MPKEDLFDEGTISETGNWNVADKFSKVKIMLPLAKCEFYEDLAQFGYESFIDDLVNWYKVPMDVIKLKGLTRLIKELLRICKNTKFAMKKGSSKEDLIKYENQLVEINKVLPALYKYRYDQVRKTRELKLFPELFDQILNRVIEIKSKINEPLNQNDLIFVSKEEFDPRAFKKKLMERMGSKG